MTLILLLARFRALLLPLSFSLRITPYGFSTFCRKYFAVPNAGQTPYTVAVNQRLPTFWQATFFSGFFYVV
jgi:hypothetical protein